MKNKRLKATRLGAWLLIQLLLPVGLAHAGKQLTQEQAEQLLLNIPSAIAAKEKHGCPSAEIVWRYERKANLVFSMHDHCSKSAPDTSDFLGLYAVDLRNAEVWNGAEPLRDRSNVIDSPRLKELRREFLGRRK
jgi:hypothetical protein